VTMTGEWPEGRVHIALKWHFLVSRLISFHGNQVTFRWRDYAHGNKKRKMTLSAEEFIRRFLLHVLQGLVRTRHFGFRFL